MARFGYRECKMMPQAERDRQHHDLNQIPLDVRREMLLKAYETGYGFPDEWSAFAKRNPEFVDAVPELMEFAWEVFTPTRRYTLGKPNEFIAFSLLGLAQEDFQHVLC